MSNQEISKGNNYLSIYFLALLCLFFYIFRYVESSMIFPVNTQNKISSPIYLEIKKNDQPAFILKINRGFSIKDYVNTEDFSYIPQNGDKIVIKDNDLYGVSRMDGRKSLALGIPIGINSAGIDDLVVLPGIGNTLADRIVRYRENRGRFRYIEEIKRVRGIGEKKFEYIRPLISLD